MYTEVQLMQSPMHAYTTMHVCYHMCSKRWTQTHPRPQNEGAHIHALCTNACYTCGFQCSYSDPLPWWSGQFPPWWPHSNQWSVRKHFRIGFTWMNIDSLNVQRLPEKPQLGREIRVWAGIRNRSKQKTERHGSYITLTWHHFPS